MRILRLFSLGGLAGPLLFILAVILSAALRPGYDHVSQLISELGETGGSTAQLMTYLGFYPTGILILLFSVSCFAAIRRNLLSLAGAVLVAFASLAIILAGIFPCDVGCAMEDPSTDQILHTAAAMGAFLAMIVASILWSLRFRTLDHWRGLWIYSLVTGMVAFVLLVAFVMLSESQIAGLVQKLLVLVLFIWLMVFAARLWSTWEASRQEMTTASRQLGQPHLDLM